MTNDCIFCKIIAGELPAKKVYEDDNCLAFMDINPVTKGHTLVIPKKHFEDIMNTPDDLLGKVIAAARKVALAQKNGLHADAVNVTQANGQLAGQIIPHIHFHIIPRLQNDPESHGWTHSKYKDDAEMNSYAEKIAGAIKQ